MEIDWTQFWPNLLVEFFATTGAIVAAVLISRAIFHAERRAIRDGDLRYYRRARSALVDSVGRNCRMVLDHVPQSTSAPIFERGVWIALQYRFVSAAPDPEEPEQLALFFERIRNLEEGRPSAKEPTAYTAALADIRETGLAVLSKMGAHAEAKLIRASMATSQSKRQAKAIAKELKSRPL
jgi:hypothetical protein